MDFITNLPFVGGCDSMFAIVDYFTKMTHFHLVLWTRKSTQSKFHIHILITKARGQDIVEHYCIMVIFALSIWTNYVCNN